MASDYSEYQGSDYYHLTKPPKQNNLVDGLNAALQTFIAIRSGKAQMDRQEKDRATKEKYTGEDRTMAKEKHQADMEYSKERSERSKAERDYLLGAKTEKTGAEAQNILNKNSEDRLKLEDDRIIAEISKLTGTDAYSVAKREELQSKRDKIAGELLKTAAQTKAIGEGKSINGKASTTTKASPQALLKAVDSDLNWLSEQEMKVANAMKKNDMGEEVEDAGAMGRITNSKPYKDKLKMIYLNLKSASENLPEGEKLSAAHQDVFEALKPTFEGKLPAEITKPATTEKGAVDPLKTVPVPPKSLLESARETRVGLTSPLM